MEERIMVEEVVALNHIGRAAFQQLAEIVWNYSNIEGSVSCAGVTVEFSIEDPEAYVSNGKFHMNSGIGTTPDIGVDVDGAWGWRQMHSMYGEDFDEPIYVIQNHVTGDRITILMGGLRTQEEDEEE